VIFSKSLNGLQKMILKTFIFVFIFLWCNALVAEEKLPDFSKMSIEEIEKLPFEVRKKVPIENVPDLKEMMPFMNIALVKALSSLMYFDLPKKDELANAIKKFQADIGQEQTGKITYEQLGILQSRAIRISDNPINVPGIGKNILVHKSEDYLLTEGTWILEGEKHGYPINHSRINCSKSRGTCEVLDMNFIIPSLDQDSKSYSLFFMEEEFKIVSWDKQEVISHKKTDCRSNIMTINELKNEVLMIVRDTTDEGCEFLLGKRFEPLKKPRIARLLPGWDISTQYWDSREKKTRKYMSTGHSKRLKPLIEKLKLKNTKKTLDKKK
jgi:hypothetical protein